MSRNHGSGTGLELRARVGDIDHSECFNSEAALFEAMNRIERSTGKSIKGKKPRFDVQSARIWASRQESPVRSETHVRNDASELIHDRAKNHFSHPRENHLNKVMVTRQTAHGHQGFRANPTMLHQRHNSAWRASSIKASSKTDIISPRE